jgi:hypothetical protein
MAAPPAERRDLTSAFKNWFSPKFPDPTHLPDAYVDTRQDELSKPALVPKRTTSKAAPGKTEQPNKTANGKPGRQQTISDDRQDRNSTSAVALLEAAGDKPVPGLLNAAPSDLQKAIEAVGDKDIVIAPPEPLKDWERALYEEFLRWRLRQIGLKQLKR